MCPFQPGHVPTAPTSPLFPLPRLVTASPTESVNRKPAFQHITASARIELIDQKAASITHRAVKFECVTKCKDFSVTYF